MHISGSNYTSYIYLVALILWNLTSHQRHFHWLLSSFSMLSSSQRDEIELTTMILPVWDGFWLKRWWYFEVELPDMSAVSKNYLINEEQKYGDMNFGEGDVSRTNWYWRQNKQLHENKLPLYLSILMFIYVYKCARSISKHY